MTLLLNEKSLSTLYALPSDGSLEGPGEAVGVPETAGLSFRQEGEGPHGDIGRDGYPCSSALLQHRKGERTEPGQDQDGQQEVSSKEYGVADCQGEEVLQEVRGIDKDTGVILYSTFSPA